MSHYADIAVYGRDSLLKLLVEVKSKSGATPTWAARLRRNMYAHGQLPSTPYFLLALPDRFFLWRPDSDPLSETAPNYEAKADIVLRPYLGSAGDGAPALTEWSLELAVASWLNSLISSYDPTTLPSDSEWLRVSGLMDAIRGGRLDVQTVV